MSRRWDFDMDLHRDEASAFGPASLAEGGLLPYEGRTLVGPNGLPPGTLDAQQDGWLSPNNPILVRGLARILPLAWRGDPKGGHGSGVEPKEIAAFASQMQGRGMRWAGSWRGLDELMEHWGDSIASYVDALRSAGATRADVWTYSETIGVALVWAGDDDEGTLSLALHVVPASWVSERRVKKAVYGIDLRWSWADVIALYAARTGEHNDVQGSSADSVPA